MPSEFRITRRVEFCETDLAGIVHFTNFFRYMESVEHAFYRSIGGSVLMPKHDPPMGLPRVHASCDYRRPLRFEDVIEVHLLVREKKDRSLTYEIRFRRIEPGPPEDVAVGKLVVVCVTRDETGQMRATPLPSELMNRIEVAPLDIT